MQNTPQTARERVESLRREIEHHRRLYYENDAPEISDFAFDALFRELTELEARYPELDRADSPTHRVGGAASDKYAKVTHTVRLGSLDDVFDYDELRAFINGAKQALLDAGEAEEDILFTVEPKIDGLSVALSYEGGTLTLGATRGDGKIGENVTENVRAIATIPHRLDAALPTLTVRGEVYMPRESFRALNRAREEAGEKLWANPRNAAAGSLRQLDASVTAERKLDIFVFNYQSGTLYEDGHAPASHTETIRRLGELGLPTVRLLSVSGDTEEILSAIDRLATERDALSYDIDGAVVKIDSLRQREILGEGTSTPHWAVAYKYPPEQKETRLLGITFQIGRTGVLTPTAELSPVTLAQTTVSRATLHNMDIIRARDLRIGDTVLVQKAGDIIPEIVGSIPGRRTGEEIPVTVPDTCPSCGERLIFEREDEGDTLGALRCINPACPAQIERRLTHFASKGAMGIDGMGPQVVRALLASGLIRDAADIYTLDAAAVASLERMGEKSAANLLASIERSRSAGAAKLLYALGIRHTGEIVAATIVRHTGGLRALLDTTAEQLCEIPDVGAVTAGAVTEFFSLPETRALLERLEAAGVQTETVATDAPSPIFEGKTFVLTGTLPTLSREEASEMIRLRGGKASSSVSQKTDYVLAGEKAGSKLTRAHALGIPVIGEDEFLSMLREETL